MSEKKILPKIATSMVHKLISVDKINIHKIKIQIHFDTIFFHYYYVLVILYSRKAIFLFCLQISFVIFYSYFNNTKLHYFYLIIYFFQTGGEASGVGSRLLGI